MKLTAHNQKLFLVLGLFLAFLNFNCSSSNTDEEETTTTSSASAAICTVSTKYVTGDQVTTAFSDTDFDGDCVLDDGDVSGITDDHICTGGEKSDCDDNCTDVYNILQEDGDSDGVGDYCDNCADVSNVDQADNDLDGVGDACDEQSDHDSILDAADNCPYVTNEDQADSNANGIGDACEETEEVTEPACDNSCDLDGDGMGNDCDDDMDDDAVTNDYDLCPLSKSVVDCGSSDDTDGDGVVDTQDNCISTANPCQTDADGDGMGAECDTNGEELADADGDGIADSTDNCPDYPDATNECKDTDGDGIYDNEDNCKTKSNSTQFDYDDDGIGNECDTETCDDSIDNDGDGKKDCSDSDCDEQPYCDVDNDGKDNSEDCDIDNDGLCNEVDRCDYNDEDDWYYEKVSVSDYGEGVEVCSFVKGTCDSVNRAEYDNEDQWNSLDTNGDDAVTAAEAGNYFETRVSSSDSKVFRYVELSNSNVCGDHPTVMAFAFFCTENGSVYDLSKAKNASQATSENLSNFSKGTACIYGYGLYRLDTDDDYEGDSCDSSPTGTSLIQKTIPSNLDFVNPGNFNYTP